MAWRVKRAQVRYETERAPIPERKRLYDTAWWKRTRKAILNERPLCVECAKEGRHEMATDVDHRTPHKGDPALFYKHSNLQPMCHRCHSAKSAGEATEARRLLIDNGQG